MNVGKTLFVESRNGWRKWLEENHDKENEIWLIYYKKHTSGSTIPYGDAVEEALCFGWIDGIVKKLDEERYVQRFSPRNADSVWSLLNKKRALNTLKRY